MKRPLRIASNRASFRAIRSFCSELKRERRARRLVGEVGDCEVGELLDPLALLADEADASSAPIPLRQIGQVLCELSQALAQDSWNQWEQGSTTTSVLIKTSSMQTLHSPLPSGPSIFSSRAFFGRDEMASAGAGPGALDC